MNLHWALITLFVYQFSGNTYAQQNLTEPPLTAEEISKASFPPMEGHTSADTLYRGVQGDFFNLFRSARLMLGDERAEHASWAVAAKLKEENKDQEDLDAYRRAKRKTIALWSDEVIKQLPHIGWDTFNVGQATFTFGAAGINASDNIKFPLIFSGGAFHGIIFKIHPHQRSATVVRNWGDAGSIDIIPVFISHDEMEWITVENIRLVRGEEGTVILYALQSTEELTSDTKDLKKYNQRLAEIVPCRDPNCEFKCPSKTWPKSLLNLCEKLQDYTLDGRKFKITE